MIISNTLSYSQGLRFYGLEDNIQERTSLDIFRGKRSAFREYLDISFQMSTLPYSDFGYILRIKDSEDRNLIWNLSYDRRPDRIEFCFNQEGHHSLIKASIPGEEMKFQHWTEISLRMDLKQDSVSLKIGDRHFTAPASDFHEYIYPQIIFGKSDHIIDVPSFIIRNLEIEGRGRHCLFEFDEAAGNEALDSKSRIRARVENPGWLVKESLEWTRQASMSSETEAGSNYNPVTKEVLYYNREKLQSYNITDGASKENIFKSPCPVDIKLGSSIISLEGDKLYEYEVFDERHMEDGAAEQAELDINALQWRAMSSDQLDMPMHHHAGILTPDGKNYIVYGGFGNMLYNGSFYSFDMNGHWSELWQADSLHPTLHPRYFCSMGLSGEGDRLYIFGGMGNESGEQIVGRRYYYDLHCVDLATGHCERLWSLEWGGGEENMVPVRNLIVNGDSFYTLCYPEYKSSSKLQLYRFSIIDGTFETLGNEIPIISDRMLTNANLFYDDGLKRMIALVQEFDDDIRSTLNIYTISFPPLSGTKYDREQRRTSILYFIFAAFISAILITGGLLNRRKREKAKLSSSAAIPLQKYAPEPKINGIYMFGGPVIIDREGRDITSCFSLQQQTILILLVEYNLKQGLSGRRMRSILWPDKDEEKAKNSRGVAINVLRKKLSALDDVEIVFDDGHYKLVYGPKFHCDYFTVLTEVEKKSPDKATVFNAISGGKFMEMCDNELFDSFKGNLENTLAEFIQKEMSQKLMEKNYETVIRLSEMMFRIDPLDEAAIAFVKEAYCKMHRKDEALTRYAAFASEYRKVNGEDFGVPFEKL